jgi:hypothetical protein
MGMVISPESELGKEIAKWEKPYVYAPFPKMLYKAQPSPLSNGKVMIFEQALPRWRYPAGVEGDNHFAAAELAAHSFNSSNQLVVRSEAEYARATSDGWCDGPMEALEFHEGLQRDISTAAAEAAYSAKGMTSKAQAERKTLDASTDKHVTK